MTDDTETTQGGTPKPKRAELVQAAIDAKIPQHRQEEKTSDTVKGLTVMLVGGLVMAGLLWLRRAVPAVPWWVLGLPTFIILFGAFSTDDEWIALKTKKFIATMGDVADAVLSRIRGTPPPPPTP